MLEFDASCPSSVSVYVPLATSVEVEVEPELELPPQPRENPTASNRIKPLKRFRSFTLFPRIPKRVIPAMAMPIGNVLCGNGNLLESAAIAFLPAKYRTVPFVPLEMAALHSDSEV